jgi:hypothetical protein
MPKKKRRQQILVEAVDLNAAEQSFILSLVARLWARRRLAVVSSRESAPEQTADRPHSDHPHRSQAAE